MGSSSYSGKSDHGGDSEQNCYQVSSSFYKPKGEKSDFSCSQSQKVQANRKAKRLNIQIINQEERDFESASDVISASGSSRRKKSDSASSKSKTASSKSLLQIPDSYIVYDDRVQV